MLTLASQNLDILSEINRYKHPKMLNIKVNSEDDINNLIKYIDVIRNTTNRKIILYNSIDKNYDISKYENFINEKIILFKSEVVKNSIGIDRLPTYKVNPTPYNIVIDGKTVSNNSIYILKGNEEEYFVKDMEEIARYINISSINFKNMVFNENYSVKQAIKEVVSKEYQVECKEIACIGERRPYIYILRKKLKELFNINLNFNKKQKAFPIFQGRK